MINGVADVVVSSAQAGVTSMWPPDCTGGDYVSGPGWITGTPTGSKAHFGVEGGIRNGAYWGHLSYNDKGSGLDAQGTSVTQYRIGATPNSRHIEGTAAVNGVQGYTYSVDVTSNDNSGQNDVFSISLSNGYRAAGYLGGGHIQLHDPCE
jgi:hypothetical protein